MPPMLPRAASLAGRRPQMARPAASSLRAQQRFNSSSPSPFSSFYKTFGRPIAKVSLLAIFTYQLVYWGWAKLETDEIRAERTAEIAALEGEVKRLQELQEQQKQQQQQQPPSSPPSAPSKAWWRW